MIGMMHDYFIYFALSGLLLALIYLIIMCYYGNGIFFTETTPDPNQIPSTFISVVVCFRNEEKNLARLIQGLAEQNYPTNLFEIILYDDESDDQSLAIISNTTSRFPNHQIICRKLNSEDNCGSAKKRAIMHAVLESRAALIAITDADCMPARGWLNSMSQIYEQKQAVMIAGPVTLFSRKSLLSYLQQIEMLALGAVTAGAIGNKRPIMCNAANMAFDRETFLSINPYHNNLHIPGGDDVFLLHRMSEQYRKQIKFIAHPDALVQTEGQESLKSYLQQRIRWAAKTKSYQHIPSVLLAIIVFLVNLILLCSPLYIVVGGLFNGLGITLMILCIKYVADAMITLPYVNLIRRKTSYLLLFLLQLPEALLTCYIAIRSLRGSYQWKNRRQQF
jgi:cellulose synthase/poly-beta-1,6-N-acetylglucosamine synthase-like glycosyltransferase